MRQSWPLWMFGGLALVGAAIIALTFYFGSIRICGRMSGCTSYSFGRAPGLFLLSLSPAFLLLATGVYGFFWMKRVQGRR
jgi:hypothetical protein